MSSIVSFIEHNDISFFYLLNKKLRCRILNVFMRSVTQIGSTSFSICITLLFILLSRSIGIKIMTNLIISQAIIQLLKRLINRPRPYKTLDWVIALKPPKCRYSFPSGHSSSSLSIALTLTFFFPGLKIAFLAIALIVGMSRIYLGYHYPTDVSIGFLISYAVFEAIEHLIL